MPPRPTDPGLRSRRAKGAAGPPDLGDPDEDGRPTSAASSSSSRDAIVEAREQHHEEERRMRRDHARQ